MTTLNLPLTDEQETRLQNEARSVGLTPADYALRRLFADEEPLGMLTAIASEDALAGIWDTPEEDEAWRHLQPAT
jgi:hypothetical protein